MEQKIRRDLNMGSNLRRLRYAAGLSQEKLAEKAHISRSLLSFIEAPNLAYSFSLNVFFNLADALEVPPELLIEASIFPDKVLKGKDNQNNG